MEERDEPVAAVDEQRFGSILDHLREGFQVIDRDWRYVYVNDTVCVQGKRSREQLLGRTMMACYPGIETTPMFRMLEACMERREPAAMENEFHYPDGSLGWFELRVEPVHEGVAVLSHDVTERRRLEEQLRHAQRMDAVGRLAGGIAHDFNNILTAILTFTEFALEGVGDHPVAEDLREVNAAARRAEALVKQLLAFSRKQRVSPRVADLNAVVTGLDAMLGRLLGERVRLTSVLDPDLWRVRIDITAFEQVIVNLVVNARDAMPDGGRVTIETHNVQIDAAMAMARGGTLAPGEYVVLSVTDTGLGMPPEVQDRLFEPYFTTKPAGQGTGLGLATCYGIVRQLGGHLWVYSELNSGTKFTVYLPRVDAPVGAVEGIRPAALAQGTETVLVVEDDPSVRRLAVRALERGGYTVLAALDGRAGFDLAVAHTGPLHLLLTDVVMPNLAGPELAARLRQRRPDLPVVFMSGYSEAAFGPDGLGPNAVLLEKPFSAEQLCALVRTVLDRHRTRVPAD